MLVLKFKEPSGRVANALTLAEHAAVGKAGGLGLLQLAQLPISVAWMEATSGAQPREFAIVILELSISAFEA